MVMKVNDLPDPKHARGLQGLYLADWWSWDWYRWGMYMCHFDIKIYSCSHYMLPWNFISLKTIKTNTHLMHHLIIRFSQTYGASRQRSIESNLHDDNGCQPWNHFNLITVDGHEHIDLHYLYGSCMRALDACISKAEGHHLQASHLTTIAVQACLERHLSIWDTPVGTR